MGVVLIGTVDSSYRVLNTMIDLKAPVQAVLSLSPADAVGVSDYADLGSLARENNIEHHYIKNVNDPAVVGYLTRLKPDVIFVIGWSQLIRQDIIAIPHFGCVGAHPALLPRNRGRAVIPWVLIRDEAETGMTLFYINEGTDSGDIIAQSHLTITDNDTAQTIYDRAVDELCTMIRVHLKTILDGRAPRTVQNESEATYCARRRAEDGLVNWADTTRTTFNLIRAVTRPYPGAFTYYGRKLIRVWAASPGDEEWSALPGQILRVDPHKGALIKTGDGTLWISELEVDGTSERPDHVFKHIGDKLGPPDTFALIQRIEELEAKLDRRAGGEN